MYVSQKIRRAIVLSVMTGSLVLVPACCQISTVVDLPVPIIAVAHAEVRTYTGVGEDYASEFET